MMTTEAQKRRVAHNCDPLHEAGILQRVLSYVPKQWLFLAPVSSLWRSVYASLAAGDIQTVTYGRAASTRVRHQTLYSAAFASPSRVRLAYNCGLRSSYKGYYQHAAGRYGTAASLLAARALGMRFTTETMWGAVKCNQLPVLEFLCSQGCFCEWGVAEVAAKRGALDILRWLYEHGCAWDSSQILKFAASSGDVSTAAWVKQQPGTTCDAHVMSAAAEQGHTAMCEYLHAEQCPWSELACDGAAKNGHVHTLRWLHEHGCPWYAKRLFMDAAAAGNIEILEYMQQEGTMATAKVLTCMLNIAGAYNKLEVAQWLRQQGADWPAVLRVHGTVWLGDTLAWARAEGCTSPF
eukprot:20122-Heterococcus_DN1.PRE.1